MDDHGGGIRSDWGTGSRTQVAYTALKHEILSNRLAPGEPLPIERFIRELGLSRTPIREAIQQLETEGFVEVRPRMGTFVSQLDLREIREMYELRQALEGFAARLVVGRVAVEELEELERRLRRHEGRDPDLAEISADGQRLHDLIIGSCGNDALTRSLRSIQDHFTRYRSISLRLPEKIMASHAEHLAILEALRSGDADRAEQLVRAHFAHAGRSLLESLVEGHLDRWGVTVG